jgi:predicted RNA-binding protein with PIN domain
VTSDLAPIPDALLAPLLDAAGSVLRALDARDVPASVRSLVGFDARGLMRGAARRQLQRALETDDAFRERVAEGFLARDDVADLRERWSARDALTLVDDAGREGKLAMLASMLYAARPDGWTFGFGVAYASAARDAEDALLRAEARGRAAELAGAAEARRRAEAARLRADEQRERAEEELRAERQSRREGLVAAERARDEALREAAGATDALAAASAAADAADAATSAATARAERAEARVVELEAELADARRRPQPAIDAAALHDVAHEMRGIADQLDALAAPAPAPPSAPSPPPVTRAPLVAASSRPRPRPRRTRPTCPPGVVADSRAGLDGMLRTRGVLLVVDGYNVSKTAWGDVPLEEQRQRLVAALAELHLRIRCEVIVVFDGADVRGVPLPRKPGVRVVFSDAGETADDVVVREAGVPATTIPIVVASSDAEVKTRAEAVGAAVVQSAVLLSVLRR